MLELHLPEEIERRLVALAAKTGRSEAYHVRQAILTHIDDLEDRYLALHRLENLGKRISLDQLEQDLD